MRILLSCESLTLVLPAGNVTMWVIIGKIGVHFMSDTKYNVLIVSDDPIFLKLLTHFLEDGSHQVRTASDGNQALQMVLQDCPDVIISDWMIPGLDGLELCRRVRQLHSRKVLHHYSYILILTSHYGKNSTLEALEAGADDFIGKDLTSLSEFWAEIQARLNAAVRIRRLEIDLEYAAKYDALTRLFNRVAFFDVANIIWDRSIRNKTPLAAVMIDCDMFKRINDIHGHLAGDAVLVELAGILRSFSRTSDIICRYGGEEFCAILPGCNEQLAWDWADRIRQQCEAMSIEHAGIRISITVSFGVAERTESTRLIDHIIDRADQALLAAKERGRNQCICYSKMSAGTLGEGRYFAQHVTDNITAGDVMVPFPLSIQPQDSAAMVAGYFLETPFETLPVTDGERSLMGTVSETDFITMIGQEDRWTSPIEKLVSSNAASYPATTPIRTIIDFLCRTTVRHVLIVQDKMLVGYISRSMILRWLRNHWATVSGKYDNIIANTSSYEMPVGNLRTAVDTLKEALVPLDSALTDSGCENLEKQDRERMVSAISQCQDAMDQVLKYGSITAAGEDKGYTQFSGNAVDI